MADARRVSTRRAVLSFSQLKNLSNFPDLLLKDYQGILQDFVFTVDEIDKLEQTVIEEQEQIDAIKADIVTIEGQIEDIEEGIIDIREDIVDLQLRVAALEYRFYTIVNTTVSLITEPFQTIMCKNTSPIEITLDTDAVENDEVNIKRKGASVNVIGLIDGLTDININVKNYSMKLVFDGTEWSEI